VKERKADAAAHQSAAQTNLRRISFLERRNRRGKTPERIKVKPKKNNFVCWTAGCTVMNVKKTPGLIEVQLKQI
jgi:hypothetical protein